MFATIGFLITDSIFKTPFEMFVIIWRYYVLTLAISLLSLLEVLIIVVLFITLSNLKQFTCRKILCLMIVDWYMRNAFQVIHIKNRIWNYYFENIILKYSRTIILFLIKAKKKQKKKKKERKNILNWLVLINEKHGKD